jgi:predicted ABC-type ATPase
MSTTPRVIILARPHCAGKTTFAREFRPQQAQCLVDINADLIAAGLPPLASETAALSTGRLMRAEFERRAKRAKSFAFETMCRGSA